MNTACRFTLSLLLALAMATGLALTTAIAGEHDDIYENEVASSTDLTSDDISDAELEGFLLAAEQVQDIRASYAEMIREGDSGEWGELRQGAVDDMTTAIQFNGLDVDTYRAIGYLYQNDDEVKQRLDAMAAEM
ncbi:DUF4168 domain-containing protein [Aquisalimonas sp.]|uniref:DUF4168 domain-containing protein n=1 Tax=Aquisalimonas sp. TaxID=1872621 RepID=UPI0025C0A231|nr:DUF4168 domain-containing protein [Aquisalimonas sp.]